MDTSVTLIRKIRAKWSHEHGGKILTDYGLAKLLSMSPQGIHSWKTRGSVFDDKTGERISEYLGLDPAYVLSCLAAERTKDEKAKKTYERIAKVFQYAARTAAAILLGVVVLQSAPLSDFTLCILCQILLWIMLLPVRSYRGNLSGLSA